MTCLHNHDQILECLRKIFLKGFQIYQNYLCALMYYDYIILSFCICWKLKLSFLLFMQVTEFLDEEVKLALEPYKDQLEEKSEVNL